jgi:hypothetical protein
MCVSLVAIGVLFFGTGFSQTNLPSSEPTQSNESKFLIIDNYQPNMRIENQKREQVTLSELIQGYEAGSITDDNIAALLDLNHLSVDIITSLGVDKDSKLSKKVYEAKEIKLKAIRAEFDQIKKDEAEGIR